MIILSEYDAFQRLINGLRMAQDGAKMMSAHQPDKGFMWLKMAETYEVCIKSVYKLSEEAASRVVKQ